VKYGDHNVYVGTVAVYAGTEADVRKLCPQTESIGDGEEEERPGDPS